MSPFATKLCNLFGCLIAIPSIVVIVLMVYLMARNPESAYSGNSELQSDFKTIHSTLDHGDVYQRWSNKFWDISNGTTAVLILPLDETIFDDNSTFTKWYGISHMDKLRYSISNSGLAATGGSAFHVKNLTQEYCIINLNNRLLSKYANPDVLSLVLYHEYSHCVVSLEELLNGTISDHTQADVNNAAVSALNQFELIYGDNPNWPDHSLEQVKELTIYQYWQEVAADLMGAQLMSKREGIPLKDSVEIYNKETSRTKNLIYGLFLHHTFFYLDIMESIDGHSIENNHHDYLSLLNEPHPLGMETLITEMYARHLRSQYGFDVYKDLSREHIEAVKAYIHQ
ncbi:hypothetical protein AB6D11_05980 [Vibrio splendidus]